MKKKTLFLSLLGLILLGAAMVLSVCNGARDISFEEIVHAFTDYSATMSDMLIRDVRVPRAICSGLVGGMLALAGAVTQGVLRNPVAEPSIMGVTRGATLAVAIAAVSPRISGIAGNCVMALIGAGISGALVIAFTMTKAGNNSITKMLLAGSALSSFFLSLSSVVALVGNRSQELAFWSGGGFRSAGWSQVIMLLVIGGLLTVYELLCSSKINLISLGDEVAVGLGVNPDRVKFSALAALIPICGVCVAAGGNISYVGLLVPHIMRKISGGDYRRLLPLSFIWGAVVLVLSDILARTLISPYELPVGLFTACLGVPVFLILIRKEKY